MATQNWYQPLDTNYLNQVDNSRAAGQTYRMNEMKILGEQRKTQQEQAINELTNLAANGDQQAMQKLSMVAPERAKGAFDYQENQIKVQNQKITRGAQVAQGIEYANPDFKQQRYVDGIAKYAKEYPDEDLSFLPQTYNKIVSSYLQQMILEGRKVEDVRKDEENKVNMQYKQALTTKALREPVGGELPAPLKLANEYDKARKAGDFQRMNDIGAFSKIYDKGLQRDKDGNIINMNGYNTAFQNLKGSQKLAEFIGKGQAEAIMALADKADSAKESLMVNAQTRKLLDTGVITGFGANYKLGFGKALQAAGFNVAEDATANTEAFVANTAQSVGDAIKAFGAGTGLSDADREFAKEMVGGKITLNEKSIRKILDMRDKLNRSIIDKYSKRRDNLAPNLKDSLPNVKDETNNKRIESPNTPRVRRFNPQTGAFE